jgi:hypothetical protein
MRPATKTTTPKKGLTGVAKGQTRQGSPTKDIPKKTKIGQGSTRGAERTAMETEEK